MEVAMSRRQTEGAARVTFEAGFDEVLDQLRARCFVLDQDDGRVRQQMLFVDGALEVWIGELLARDVDEIKVGSFKAAGRADRFASDCLVSQ